MSSCKRKKALQIAAVILRLPEQERNSWPDLFRNTEFDIIIETLSEPGTNYIGTSKKPEWFWPVGFLGKKATLDQAGARVVLQSGWNARFGYLLQLSVADPIHSLKFGKEVQNMLLRSGCTMHTKDLSYLDEFIGG